MKKIDILENAARNENLSLTEQGINTTLYCAYRASHIAKNDLFNFSEVIWDYDVEPIAIFMKENGITEFTISSTFSSLIPTLVAFEKQGFQMAGLTEVNATYRDWQTGELTRVPAIRLRNI